MVRRPAAVSTVRQKALSRLQFRIAVRGLSAERLSVLVLALDDEPLLVHAVQRSERIPIQPEARVRSVVDLPERHARRVLELVQQRDVRGQSRRASLRVGKRLGLVVDARADTRARALQKPAEEQLAAAYRGAVTSIDV